MIGETAEVGTAPHLQRQSEAPKLQWKDQSLEPVWSRQILYMWKTSLPSQWSQICARPLHQIKGQYSLKRDTLEFLKETQRYIATIRKPLAYSHPHLPRQSPVSHTHLPAPRLKTAEIPEKDKKPLGGVVSIGTGMRSDSLATLPRRESQLRISTEVGKLHRVRSQGLAVVEASLSPAGDTNYAISSYLPPHSLVPTSRRKTHTSRPASRLVSSEVASFLSRFERKHEAEVAPIATKKLPGWKLRLGYRPEKEKCKTDRCARGFQLEGKQI